jgi:hypothetical protein
MLGKESSAPYRSKHSCQLLNSQDRWIGGFARNPVMELRMSIIDGSHIKGLCQCRRWCSLIIISIYLDPLKIFITNIQVMLYL